MPQPLPILVFDETDPVTGEVTVTDLRELGPWVALVVEYLDAWVGEILAATDWLPIKAFETGVPLDPQIAADRATVRLIANIAEAELLAATSLAEVDAIEWSQTLGPYDTSAPALDTSGGS